MCVLFKILIEVDDSVPSFQAMIYFKSKDRDRDGRISFDEFCDRETVSERAFRAMDTNGDGYISKSEMLQASTRGARRQVNASENRLADMHPAPGAGAPPNPVRRRAVFM